MSSLVDTSPQENVEEIDCDAVAAAEEVTVVPVERRKRRGMIAPSADLIDPSKNPMNSLMQGARQQEDAQPQEVKKKKNKKGTRNQEQQQQQQVTTAFSVQEKEKQERRKLLQKKLADMTSQRSSGISIPNCMRSEDQVMSMMNSMAQESKSSIKKAMPQASGFTEEGAKSMSDSINLSEESINKIMEGGQFDKVMKKFAKK